MNGKQKRILALVCMVSLCCAAMLLVDGVLRPDYWLKSAAKVTLFLLCPLLYSRIDPEFRPKQFFAVSRKGLLPALGLGCGVFVFIMAAYWIFSRLGDFSAITGLLEENIGVDRDNFLLVAIYISFINSLLEEFFFRGFAFFTLKPLVGRGFAYVFSALVFAVYHTAMMLGWWDWWLFALALAGLFVGGLLFDFLNERTGTIWSSWMVHMFANFAINTVGCILFGIL